MFATMIPARLETLQAAYMHDIFRIHQPTARMFSPNIFVHQVIGDVKNFP
jgi:hypothetical protein